MREIKFRFWNQPEGTMETVSQLNFSPNIEGVIIDDLARQKHLYLMQYTGLKDKNGKEIYEGDIVYLRTPGLLPRWLTRKTGWDTQCVVEWGYSGFDYVYRDTMSMSGRATIGMGEYPHEVELEVIGNIYENPELLK